MIRTDKNVEASTGAYWNLHTVNTNKGKQVKMGSGSGKELRIIQEERFLMERIWWKNCLVKIMKTGC